MYSFLRNLRLKQALVVEAPSLTVSMLIAEFFYKFRSFTLECIAFLATWLVISALFSWCAAFLAPRAEPVHQSPA